MADLATLADVETHWRRLGGYEAVVATTSLKGASANLRSRVGDVDGRIEAEAEAYPSGPKPFADLVSWTVAESVARKLRAIFIQGDQTAQTFYYQSEIDALVSTGLAVGEPTPVGSFPATCTYPTF